MSRSAIRLMSAGICSGVFLFVTSARAVTQNIDVTPAMVGSGGPYTADGGGSLGDTTTGAPGWGSSSFVSNVDGSTNHYSEFQINLNTLFGRTITIGDLNSISYYTKNNSGTSYDWDIRIYTTKASPTDPSFYGNRFETPNNVAGNTNWNLWSTDTTSKVFDVYNPKTNTDTSLNDTLSQLNAAYGSEPTFYISFIAGFSGNNAAIADNLDGIKITLANGDVDNLNLVPEPSSFGLIGMAVGSCAAASRRRRR